MAGISLKRYVAGQKVSPGKNRGKFWTQGNVVYWDSFEIPGADPKTLRPLSNVWARDAKHVYCQSSAIRGADPKTFAVLNNLFAKDKGRVYCSDGVCKKCDAKSFEVLDKGATPSLPDMEDDYCGYARDAANVYYHESGEGNARHLRGADRNSFRVLKFGYAKDGKRVYAYGHRIERADPEHFQILNAFYSRDDSRVFYNQYEVIGADVKSFRAVDEENGKDAKKGYWRQWADKKK